MHKAFRSSLLCVAFFLALTATFANAFATSPMDFTPNPLSVSQVQLELGHQLSKNATLYFPNSPEYANLTMRWSSSQTPQFAVVLVPGNGEDVAVTVLAPIRSFV